MTHVVRGSEKGEMRGATVCVLCTERVTLDVASYCASTSPVASNCGGNDLSFFACATPAGPSVALPSANVLCIGRTQ